MGRFTQTRIIFLLGLVWVLLVTGCAHHFPVSRQQAPALYSVVDSNDTPAASLAPFFRVFENEKSFNRIGRPSAGLDSSGEEEIFIDSRFPVFYFAKKNFTTQKASYTNYIYRIHFSATPFSLIPFHFTAGKNSGLLVVVTVDSSAKPLLITTVHTCGCYAVTIPTSYLADSALPTDWPDKPQTVYGERLPTRLHYDDKVNPVLLISIRPGVHRVMDLEVLERKSLDQRNYNLIPAQLLALSQLEKLPIGESSTSFFHQKGIMEGFVKGAIKPWESLLLSLPSLDFFVGTDKIYDPEFKTTNPFYTSLKPWRRTESDMRNFASFLRFRGWNL